MPRFNYTVNNSNGQIISDVISAASINEAANNLKAQRFQILKLKEISQTSSAVSNLKGLSVVEKANLCRYLGSMITAGLPITEAVATIQQDTQNKALKQILSDIENNLQQGESLSSTFAKYPKNFDKVFVTIVKAGERSGTIAQSFKYLEDQLTASHALTQKVKSALVYPIVIISAMLGVGVILIVFVIPQIAQVFLKGTFQVPKTTRIILQAGLTLNQNLGLLSIIAGLLVIATIVALRTRKGKIILLGILKRVPIIAALFEKIDLTRFSRTLATLMKSGVPITEALAVSTTTLSQRRFDPLAQALRKNIKKGESIAAILRQNKDHIPQMMISMISTGEKTGTMDKILFDLAKFYEGELETDVKNFTALLEPIIMLFIGVGVGAMVLAVIAPIYSLVSSLQDIQ